MCRESANSDPEGPLGPLAQAWIDDLERWYKSLQVHFKFDPSDLASNVRRSANRWEVRLQYLKAEQPELYRSVVSNIRNGHSVPFDKLPPEFFRKRNPDSLAQDKERAWEAIKKDMNHGAIRPVNLEKEGLPHCVCPVRTAEKNNGKARFVHNSRKVNDCVPKKRVKCTLESLLKTRNMFIPGGFLLGTDFDSGYHCIYLDEDDQKYLAFALHVTELPEAAVAWLFKHHAHAFLPNKRAFVFKYLALPFGLSSSCKAFNDLVTSLMGFWRRCPTGDTVTRVSSYIDDVTSAYGHPHGLRVRQPGAEPLYPQVLPVPEARHASSWHHHRPQDIHVPPLELQDPQAACYSGETQQGCLY